MKPDTASLLLAWYDQNRRVLPWRALPGQTPDPYGVWLSEIMLQQTVVATVIPYYQRFLAAYPTVHDLAQAPLNEVLQLWAGLGYYARARNLHACAQKVSKIGFFPSDVNELLELPGIGAYTSRAIASIAFNQPFVPIDGNVERLIARLRGIEDPLPASRAFLHQEASKLNNSAIAQERPSDFAQALFDLGATICTPRNPSCLLCPCQTNCEAFKAGNAKDLPKRSPKPQRPTRYGVVFRVINPNGDILLRTRPPQGLLGGTDELPGTPWREKPWTEKEALEFAPITKNWQKLGEIKHIFTHFILILTVYEMTSNLYDIRDIKCFDSSFKPPKASALSSAMKKCIILAQG
ncbi:A/G-specific adenine glycosylase [Aristophania vespae]|uniref:A/G-specific adenine glycosylase n=1 Tax=Aristophania vespae TaxID=2697033 RepID=UPI00235157C5|nr:A/G-specific adenine glycosylase [Aristophania vespae]UMM64072.1 Adenine DNA glycosylase [Aristophania vespae]